MSNRFIEIDRSQPITLPGNLEGWLDGNERPSTPSAKPRWNRFLASSKEGMGFRRFLLRGLDAVRGEWRLVCLAFNLKRLCALRA